MTALTEPHQIVGYSLSVLIARLELAQKIGGRVTAELRAARTTWDCAGGTTARVLPQLRAIRDDLQEALSAGELLPELVRAMVLTYPPTALARYFDPALTVADCHEIAAGLGVDPELVLHCHLASIELLSPDEAAALIADRQAVAS